MFRLPSALFGRASSFALATLLAFVCGFGINGRADASIQIVSDPADSTSNIGKFEAWLTLTNVNAGEALLQVDITNQSNPANGGYITGFVFNNPGDVIDNVELTSAPSPFVLMGGPSFDNSISASPFKNFDIGAGLDATSFLGGGSPTSGLAVGSSGTFVFKLTGTDLTGLKESSFLTELSEGPGNPDHAKFFITRFRGFLNGGSDKSVGGIPGNGDGPGSVPEPATMLMWLGLGTAGLFRTWKVRNSRK